MAQSQEKIIKELIAFAENSNLYFAAERFLKNVLGIHLWCDARNMQRDDYFEQRDVNDFQYVQEALSKIEHIYPMGDISSNTLKKVSHNEQSGETDFLRYDTVRVFACEAKPDMPLRQNDVESLARAFNRANSIDDPYNCTRNLPVLIIVRQGHFLSIASCERKAKKDNSDTIGRVILRYNINCKNPRKGHQQILEGISKEIHKCSSFDDLYTTLLKSIAVDVISDNFFKEYQRIYKDIVSFASKDSGIKKVFKQFSDPNKAIRDYVKMLMGRLVFIQFLQKKGWMGAPAGESWENGDKEFLQHLFEKSDKKKTFITDILNKLFFDLNNAREGDLANPALGEGIKIPYLNGGLFGDEEFTGIQFQLPVDRMKGLLEFFRSYNFTIDENASDAVEVGIDPEMLGRIFENLLEDNKEKGAFYTPKEIVEYMCQNSLISYLQKGVKEEKRNKAYHDFVISHDASAFSTEELKYLNDKLCHVKVCDPAIGSGAFPMGMLKELFECRKAIETILGEGICDYSAIKQDIVQNSIYGVDIEKGAVDIARLRFWLALIIDEKTPHALPNMDFKIMQGNSLLERFEGVDFSKIVLSDKREPVLGNKKGRGKKKNSDVWEETLALDEELSVRNIQGAIFEYYRTYDRGKKKDLRESIINNVKSYIKHSNDCTPEIIKRIDSLPIPNDQFFLWHIFFKEVFDEGGFDIVIGNPPYIELQKMKQMSELYAKCGFETYIKSGDIYCLFTEHGFNLLKQDGILCYIMPNKWMQAEYGKPLREYLLKKKIHHIIDFGDLQLFKDATTYTCILLSSKSAPDKCFKASFQKKFDLSVIESTADTFYVSDLNSDVWVLTSNKDLLLQRRLAAKFPALSGTIKANYGIKTGLSEAFILSKEEKEKIISEDASANDIIVPFLSGKGISPYISPDPSLFLICFKKGYTKEAMGRDSISEQKAWEYMEKRFPSICRWLTPFKSKAKARSDKGDYWWELRACDYYDEFTKPKIMYQTFQVRPNFIFDTERTSCNNSMWILPTDNKAILGFLNSKMCWWFISKYCSRIQNGFQLIWDYFGQIPIAVGENQEITNLVEQILALKTDNPNVDTSAQERVIDHIIYELYGLTNGEVRTVDPRSHIVGADWELFNREIQFNKVPDNRIDEIFDELKRRFSNICSALAETKKKEIIIDRQYDLLKVDTPSKEEAQDAFYKWNCAIITAFRCSDTLSKDDNKKRNLRRNEELKSKMKELGLKFRSVDGYYREADEDEYVQELSFFITNAGDTEFDIETDQLREKEFFRKIYRLAEQYEQDCFLFTFPGRNRVAFLSATNDGGRAYFHNDIKFAGPLYEDLKEELDAWTMFSDGRLAFRLNGTMLYHRTRNEKINIGEGDIFDVKSYDADFIISVFDKSQEDIKKACESYNEKNLVFKCLEDGVQTEDELRSTILDALDEVSKQLGGKKKNRIGIHCSVPIDGSYIHGAKTAFDAVDSWINIDKKAAPQIVIIDLYGEYQALR